MSLIPRPPCRSSPPCADWCLFLEYNLRTLPGISRNHALTPPHPVCRCLQMLAYNKVDNSFFCELVIRKVLVCAEKVHPADHPESLLTVTDRLAPRSFFTGRLAGHHRRSSATILAPGGAHGPRAAPLSCSELHEREFAFPQGALPHKGFIDGSVFVVVICVFIVCKHLVISSPTI